MARYIDADKLIEMYDRSAKDEWNHKTAPSSWAEAFECAIADIDDQPTADVVLKSEVKAHIRKEGLILTIDDVTGYFPKPFIIEAIKTHMKQSEVAREIIFEIDTLICCHANGDIDDKNLYILFDELKKKYTVGKA